MILYIGDTEFSTTPDGVDIQSASGDVESLSEEDIKSLIGFLQKSQYSSSSPGFLLPYKELHFKNVEIHVKDGIMTVEGLPP